MVLLLLMFHWSYIYGSCSDSVLCDFDNSHRRRSSDVSLLQLRRAIARNERNQRYELFRLASCKSRDDGSTPLSVRDRILQWIFSEAFVSMFDTEESLLSRYTLPLLWARMQAMHHRGMDEGEERRHSLRRMSVVSVSSGYSSDESGGLSSPLAGVHGLSSSSSPSPGGSTSSSTSSSRWGSKRSSANTGLVCSLPLDTSASSLLVPPSLHLPPPSPVLQPLIPSSPSPSPPSHPGGASHSTNFSPGHFHAHVYHNHHYSSQTGGSVSSHLASPPNRAASTTVAEPSSSSASPFETPITSRRGSLVALAAGRCPSPLILNGVGVSSLSSTAASSIASTPIPGHSQHAGTPSPFMSAIAAAAAAANGDAFVAHWKKGQRHQCEQCSAAVHEMAGFILHRFAGQRMNVVVSNALLAMLVTPIQQLLSVDITSDDFGVFNREVVTADLWKAIFVCLTGASLHVRRRALKDINGLLVTATTGAANCESLLTQPGWQKWILPLFDDTAPPDPNDRLQEKVFQYSINILSMVHHYTFLQLPSEEFRTMLPMTLSLAAQSSADDSLVVSRTLLGTLVTRLALTKGQLLGGKWDDVEWLMAQVKAFVFSSPRPPPKTPRHMRHRLGMLSCCSLCLVKCP
jgi:hypothetical protein